MASEKKYLDLPLKEFLADLAAKSPTPGGGSVSAMTGAIAAAQGRMVIAYSLGKPQEPEHQKRLNEVVTELQRATEMFGQLMTEDMAAYERLAAAHKASDQQELERAVATAVAVPMEIIVLAGAVGARLDEVKFLVGRYLLCDLQVAAILAYSAARAAATSVRINLESMPDRAEAARLESQLDMLLGRATRHRNSVVHYRML